MTLYCTVQDIRNYTNIASGDYPDVQILSFVSGVTEQIDERTGRTWQGIATQSDEYYDGDGCSTLKMTRVDIQSITKLEIDDDNDDIFDTMSASNPSWYDWYNEGIIKLIIASASPSVFPIGNKNVRVTYTHGALTVPPDVKHLAILMVNDTLNPLDERKKIIEKEITRLKNIGADLI